MAEHKEDVNEEQENIKETSTKGTAQPDSESKSAEAENKDSNKDSYQGSVEEKEKTEEKGSTEEKENTEETAETSKKISTKEQESQEANEDLGSSETKEQSEEEKNTEDDTEPYSGDNDDEVEVDDEFYGIPVKAYDEMNLDAVGEELARLLKNYEVRKIRQHVREIKMEFDRKFGAERDKKKEEFLDDGGNIIDFSYSTPAEREFSKVYFEYKEKRDNYYKNVRKNLQENLERRLAIIEELKAITGVGTDMNANFKSFKKLQERWRKAGPVPRNDYKDTWNTYHYHVERFYDFLHLDREFRDLDYKHNLEQKLKMIARAEELVEEKNVNRAFRELQNLHRMWKEDVGPVAKEYKEPIWEKFSEATKLIHENRKDYFAARDKERERNLDVKKGIINKIKALEKEELTSHRQTQNKIKEFKKLRDEFFKAGKVPRKNNQETWDAFKEASREFNHEKNEFYKKRKEEQKENLKKKLELIDIAEKNKDGEDFDEITPIMKRIQSDWKKIGYVPRNKSNKIWKRFTAACNHYFDRLHARQDNKSKEAVEALKEKEEVLKEMQNLSLTGTKDEDLDKIKAQISSWNEIGQVPKNKRSIEGKFNNALDKLFSKMDMNREEAELLKYENRLQTIEESDDDSKAREEAFFLHKKIDQTSGEIRQLETNLQFFDNADKENPLMKDTFNKMDRLKQQLKIWEAKLDKLKSL